MEISEAVGNGSEGSGKYGINGAVPGRDVQGGVTVGALVGHRKLGPDTCPQM